jgi:hypothetical protein
MKKSKRATYFVPRAVFRTAFAGVVPVCVAGIACGGSQTTQGDGGSQTTQAGSGSSTSSTFFGVAQSCFAGNPGCPYGSSSGSSTSSTFFGVAQSCFAGNPGCPNNSSTSSALDAAPDHTILSGDADAAGDARVHDGGDSG